MQSPLLYEINTRCWLRALSEKHGRQVMLADVPGNEFVEWRRLGFTHIWLMGAWSGGPRARVEALAHEEQRRVYSGALPGWKEEDVAASPYAIARYEVPPSLGGEAGLREFRRKLHANGMRLVLDFVPNHVGVDHPWVWKQPEFFVQSPAWVPETFGQATAVGLRWLAHGKDPFFAAWTDTFQLDYRLETTRAAVRGVLESLADRCDGVRCDMAMLVLNDVFAKTWEKFPVSGSASAAEFWPPAIEAVKSAHPEFLFLAEAYWGTEARLRGLGFDYTYDKVLRDRLIARDAGGVQSHLLGVGAEGVAAGAHFLENHDEARIAGMLSDEQHRAAALVILGLPGMRFLHEGQPTGARLKIPVQLARRAPEPKSPGITQFYEQLLTTLPKTAVGQGTGELLKPRAAWPGNPTAQNFIVVQWRKELPEFDLVVVNLAPVRSQCYVPLNTKRLGTRNWGMKDLLGQENYIRSGDDLMDHGLYLELAGHEAQLFHFEPVD